MTLYVTTCELCPPVDTAMGQSKPTECVHQVPYVRASSLRSVGVGAEGSLPRDNAPDEGLAMGKGMPPVRVDSNTPKRRTKGLKRDRRRESAAEKKAREHFNDTVKAWPCWFSGHRPCNRCGGLGVTELANSIMWACTDCNGSGNHRCEGPKDAHHLVPKQFLRKRLEALMPEEQFLAILFNPLIGAPICRKAHDSIEAGFDRIYWEDLSEECIEYVFTLPDFVLLRLEEECPKRAQTLA